MESVNWEYLVPVIIVIVMAFYLAYTEGDQDIMGNTEEYKSINGRWITCANAEQIANERDEFERKCKELCERLGQMMIKFDQAAKDAVEMARLVQKYQRAASISFWHELDVTEAIKKAEETDYHKAAQSIIERYDGRLRHQLYNQGRTTWDQHYGYTSCSCIQLHKDRAWIFHENG